MTLAPSRTISRTSRNSSRDVGRRQERRRLVEHEETLAAGAVRTSRSWSKARTIARSARTTGLRRLTPARTDRWRARSGRRGRAPGAPSAFQPIRHRSSVARSPMRRFSRTVSEGMSAEVLVHEARCRARGTPPGGIGSATSVPPTQSLAPGSGSWKPARTLMSVDLPDPFWPSRPCTSRGPTPNETPSRARAPPKCFERFSMRRTRPSGDARPPPAGPSGRLTGRAATACDSPRCTRSRNRSRAAAACPPCPRSTCRRCRTGFSGP